MRPTLTFTITLLLLLAIYHLYRIIRAIRILVAGVFKGPVLRSDWLEAVTRFRPLVVVKGPFLEIEAEEPALVPGGGSATRAIPQCLSLCVIMAMQVDLTRRANLYVVPLEADPALLLDG